MGQSDRSLERKAKYNKSAFRKLYQHWVTPVYHYFLYRVRNPKEAEDLTSQVFLEVLEQLPNYTEKGHFPAWLFTIVRYKSADHFRSLKPVIPIDTTQISEDLLPLLDHAIHTEELRCLSRLIQALPENEQELIRLRFVAGLKYGEMAVVLKRNKEAIRKQVSRLLHSLQDKLEEENA